MNASAWIVIVNYRTADLAVDCLRSLSTQVGDLGGGRVVVADNASGDASAERLAAAIAGEGWSGWAEALPLPRNGGFAQWDHLRTQGWMGHLREYTSKEVADFLLANGYSVDRVVYRGGWSNPAANALSSLLPDLRPYFSCIALKPIRDLSSATDELAGSRAESGLSTDIYPGCGAVSGKTYTDTQYPQFGFRIRVPG